MKHLIWIRYILMALCVVVVLMGWILRENVDLLLNWMYIMLGLGIGSLLILSLYALAQNPKSAVQSLIGLVAVLVIVGVAFALSSAEPIITPTSEYTNAFALKLTDTSLYSMYALLGLSVLAIVFGEIRNAFK